MAATTKMFSATTCCHLRNLSTCSRLFAPMISFPHRPSTTERYSGVEAVKTMSIPLQEKSQSTTLAPQISRWQMPITNEMFKEERYITPNGTSVFVTDKLPSKYKRSVLSDEEIEYIMRGGPDL